MKEVNVPIEQNLSARKKHVINLQPLFVMIHFFMFIDYLFTKDSFFYNSFYDSRPYFFYGLLIVYMTMIKFYSKATGSPGYAVDEDDIEKVEDETKKDTKRFYCQHCKIYVPIRASHCSSCKKCILRRDHHCPWTNNCIGRDNHLYFFIFAFLELFSQTIPFFDVIYHLTRNYFCAKNIFSLSIIPYIILGCGSGFGSFFACRLNYSCLMTTFKNLTVWEMSRSDHITYLKNMPIGYSPFELSEM